MSRKCSLAILPTALMFYLIETVAPVESAEVPPPSATVTIAVAIASPCAHTQKVYFSSPSQSACTTKPKSDCVNCPSPSSKKWPV